MDFNIALCGFMGSGKSTVGAYLANSLNLRYVDSDKLIEEKACATISEIFDKHGEKYFRDLENDIIKGFCYLNPCVISLGGGVVLFERNVKLMRQHCKIIFLNASFDTVSMRLNGSSGRPLANVDYGSLKKLFYARLPVYKEVSDFEVDADNTPEAIASQILKLLY